ncbi:MAG TPA: PQQ-binding-like beta-propeller repeat protein [Micromonosporaceae bacterium]|nr:PQQ-binding-like beta-propeller repeat protein [Micromonosporaceae bacterium]
MGTRLTPLAAAALAVWTLAACSGSASPKTTPPATAPNSPTSTGSASPTGGTDWPVYHGTPDHHGVSTTMPAANGTPKRTQSLRLDGAVYASPLVVRGLTIVATENDSVYAFDRSYRQVWKRTLGSPSPQSERGCGNIDPLGITGTPVYDAGSDRVYVVAEFGGNVRHELFALDRATGSVAWSKNVDLPGATARDMQQRGALAIAGGKVWVPFGGQFGDCGDYKGRVVGVPLDGGSGVVAYTVPTPREGGIWHPDGPAVNAAGHLLVVVGNGAAGPGDQYDYSDSATEIDTSGKRVDFFAPTRWAQDNVDDRDLGIMGAALVGSKWVVVGGKSGEVYVLRAGHLGGLGGQVDVQDICLPFGGAAVDGDVVYLPCTDGVRAVRVDDSGKLHVLWHADPRVTGSPVIGGGRVWAVAPTGVLWALDPATGNSVGHADIGETSRFATPAIYGADLIVPTLAGIAVVQTS